MEENGVVFNAHNKEEYPPAHTAEHILNPNRSLETYFFRGTSVTR